MINLKTTVCAALNECCENVSNGYPDDFANLPCVGYIQEDNSVDRQTSSGEGLTYFRFKIDIWSKESTSNLVDKINTKLEGMKRTQYIDIEEKQSLKHTVLRYECVVDNRTLFLYHK